VQKREDWLSQRKDELEDVIQQLEEVIRIKEFAIDRLTKELGDVRDQSALLEGQRTRSLDQKEDRIEELEEALRESVRITADREVALDAETQQRTILDQKVLSSSFCQRCCLTFLNCHFLFACI
jgi:ELKS/RAB6-interacting/CAST family protein 1